jgi:hypothetical protein
MRPYLAIMNSALPGSGQVEIHPRIGKRFQGLENDGGRQRREITQTRARPTATAGRVRRKPERNPWPKGLPFRSTNNRPVPISPYLALSRPSAKTCCMHWLSSSWVAYVRFSVETSRIPTGFRLTAQGCAAGATLGHGIINHASTPTRVASPDVPGRTCRNPGWG